MRTTGQQPHADRAHAVLSASGSERWLNCTPSARMEERYPETSSTYADEGTLAHEFAEIMLRNRVEGNSKERLARWKELLNNPLYYCGMIEDVEPYVDIVLERLAADKKGVLHIEHKSDFSEFVEDGFGTSDAVIFTNGVLHVTDLKFGKGVRVDAEENTQLMLYAVGALMAFDFLYDITTVRLTIVQPRLDAMSVWDITPEALMKWANEVVKPTAKIAFAGEGEHKTGDWCKFCKAKVDCPALRKEALKAAEQDFDVLDGAVLSDDDVLQMYRIADRITDYLSAVKERVFNEALKGKKWPGLKLVEGKSNRKIVDEKMATHVLVMKKFKFSDFQNTKLKGIGDLEKLLGGKAEFEKLLGKYVEKPRGAPTLVAENDPRPVFSSADDFKDEEDNADDLI